MRSSALAVIPCRYLCCTPKETSSTGNATKQKEPSLDWKRYSPLFETDSRKRDILDAMLRINHAGEVGAREIYAGQLAVFRGTPIGQVIEVYWDGYFFGC